MGLMGIGTGVAKASGPRTLPELLSAVSVEADAVAELACRVERLGEVLFGSVPTDGADKDKAPPYPEDLIGQAESLTRNLSTERRRLAHALERLERGLIGGGDRVKKQTAQRLVEDGPRPLGLEWDGAALGHFKDVVVKESVSQAEHCPCPTCKAHRG